MLSSSKITEILVLQAIDSGVIKDKDHDLYSYAFHALISYTCNFVTMFVIALLMHRLLESVIFIFFFYPLRIFAGGFHEKTEMRCYVTSTTMFVSMILIDKVGVPGIPLWAICIFQVCSMIAVFVKAPIESENKPFNDRDFKKYRKTARLICAIEAFIFIVAVVLNFQQMYLYYAVAGVTTTAVLLILPSTKTILETQNVDCEIG